MTFRGHPLIKQKWVIFPTHDLQRSSFDQTKTLYSYSWIFKFQYPILWPSEVIILLKSNHFHETPNPLEDKQCFNVKDISNPWPSEVILRSNQKVVFIFLNFQIPVSNPLTFRGHHTIKKQSFASNPQFLENKQSAYFNMKDISNPRPSEVIL